MPYVALWVIMGIYSLIDPWERRRQRMLSLLDKAPRVYPDDLPLEDVPIPAEWELLPTEV